MTRFIARVCSFLLVLLLANQALGQGYPVPHDFNVQGVLRNSAGELVSGNYSITFRIYTTATGGTKLWEGTQTVAVTSGLFNVYLGPFTTNLFAGKPEAWLEIQVGSDAPVARRPVTSSGYAFVAERAVEADALTSVLPIDHGGTGSAVKNFMDLTTTQTAAGVKAFSDRVGIAVTPDAAFRLDVNGPLKVRSGGITFPDGTVQATAAGAGASLWAVSGSNIYNTNAGNVGIGTTGPAVKFDIVGTNDRMRIVSGSAQLNIGQWDGATHRIEGDANRDLLITSYSSLLRLGMSGTTHMAIHSSGRVGIGTTDPKNLLHVAGGSGDGRMQFTNDATGNAYADGMWIGVDGTQHFILGRENMPLTLSTAAAERMRVAADGKVGIGMTNPVYLLDVNGQIHSASGGFVFPDGTVQASAAGATYWAASGTNIYNTNTGRVGIGTTAPEWNLDVVGADSVVQARVTGTTGNPQFRMKASGAGGRDFTIFTSGSAGVLPNKFAIRDLTAGSLDRLVIDSSGNVGIGTTTPGANLHVGGQFILGSTSGMPGLQTAGWVTSPSGVLYDAGGVTWAHHFSTYGAGDIARFGKSSGAGQQPDIKVVIRNDGKVGIGTANPGAPLHVGGTGNVMLSGQTEWGLEASESPAFQVIDRTNNIRRGSFTTTGDIYFGNLQNATGAGATLAVRASGYVGIGTQNPQRKLVVQNNTAVDSSTILGLYNVDTTDGRDLVLSFRTDTTGAGATTFKEVAAISSSGLIHDNATAQADLMFWTTGNGALAQAMRIDPFGNVGIGMSNPTNPYGGGSSRLAVKGTEYVLTAATDQTANGTAVRIGAYSPVAQGLIEMDWFNDSNRTGGGYGVLQVGKTNWNQDLGIGAARVGIGTISPTEKLDVLGNIRSTGAHITPEHVTHMPWFNAGGVQQGYIKLVTPIVYNESNMFSIKITGFKYGSGGHPVEIRCGGYACGPGPCPPSGALISTRCHTEGTDMPVEIGTENRGGVTRVVIRLGTPTTTAWYYDHYTAQYTGWAQKNPSDFQWVQGETTPPPTGNTNLAFIDDQSGLGQFASLTLGGVNKTSWPSVHDGSGSTNNVAKWTGSMTLGNSTIYDNGNIGIGTTGPQVPLHVMGTYNAPSAGSSPNGSIVVGSTATGVQMAIGVTADVSPQFGWIQPRYSANSWTWNLALNPNGGNVGIRNTNPGYTLQVGQATAGDNTDYGIGITRHGTLASPGTWTNTPALSISDTSTDGPSSVDTVGLLSIGIGRVATGDPNAAYATMFYARNDDGGGVRIDGKKNLWVGWDQSSITSQNNSLIVQNGNVGVGTTAPLMKMQVNGDIYVTGGLISAMGLKDVIGALTGTYTGSWYSTGSVTDGKNTTISRPATVGSTLEFPMDDTGQWPMNGQPIIVFAGGHWWGDMGGGTFAIDVYNSNSGNWMEAGQFSAQGLYVFNNPIPWQNPPWLTKVRLRAVALGSYGWVAELRVFGRMTHGWLQESLSANRGYFGNVIAEDRVMQRGVYTPVGHFDVPSYVDGTYGGWTRANQRTCVGFEWSQYNEFIGPGQSMYTRLCAAFSDGSCEGDTISFRILRNEGNSPVYYTTGFSQACAGGAGLTHHVCGPWVLTSTISCGYSWGDCCRIDVRSNATEHLFVGGIQMEIAVR